MMRYDRKMISRKSRCRNSGTMRPRSGNVWSDSAASSSRLPNRSAAAGLCGAMYATIRSKSLRASSERNTLKSIVGCVCGLLRGECARHDPTKPALLPRPGGTPARKSHQPAWRPAEVSPPLPGEFLSCSYFQCLSEDCGQCQPSMIFQRRPPRAVKEVVEEAEGK